MPPIRTGQSPGVFTASPDDQVTAPVSGTRIYTRFSLSPLTDFEDEDEVSDNDHDKPYSPPNHARNLLTYRQPHGFSPVYSPIARRPASKKNVLEKLEPIIVCGHQLRPTVVWNTFWRWCYERKAIDDRRRAGQPFPWTEDKILRKEFFCNTFRILDKTTQFIVREVIEKGDQSSTEIVFRVLLFDIFTKIDTWKWLVRELGIPTWKSYERETYFRVLAQRAKNHPLYTSAFQKPSPRWEYRESWRNHLLLLENMMEVDLPGKLQNVKGLDEAYAFIAEFPGMGPFNSFQLLLNLSYSPVINFSGKDFVVPGIGCISGLSKMFGSSLDNITKSDPSFRLLVIRYMMETQDQHFRRLGLKFSGLGPQQLPMELADIEHAICEVDKYSRLAHPEIRGKRAQLKRKWTHSNEVYPSKAVLPRAWSHPKRKKVRPCNKLPIIQVRYAVAKIVGHYKDEEGEMFCQVRWVNYGPEDDTWEPAALLYKDAPTVVNEYWVQTFGRKHPKFR
ncbi:hypothetical protein GYMLUDRAFT_248138 [Collybiopsis luxurians FD-317 M1]|uniref:Chromo domain-containing protein n=1 Tax=Collybiopsis luxurians FD-317 M1 TaxID=944289 RepID=A0A0D0AZK5_9AGAR|nr:hypothetical protein GYMLUDRAFT_248138 [Collybiopsis luxurians FD-317 M1]